jgi:hypothetical protein
MTRIWYDCEFLEDGQTIELISIGMVREGNEGFNDHLYLVNEAVDDEPLKGRIRRHDWLMDNVVPHLPLPDKIRVQGFGDGPLFHLDSTSNRVVSLRFIRNAVRDFVLGTDDPELWAWYGAYDHVVLCQLFGRMINLPKGFPMWTNDLKQEVVRLEREYAMPITLPTSKTTAHHALNDALQLRDWHLYLKQWEYAMANREPAVDDFSPDRP